MKNQVKVTANPANGQVFTKGKMDAKGVQWGFIRVEEVLEEGFGSLNMSGNGIGNKAKPNSALITVSEESAIGIAAGQTREGKILIKESTTKNPFRENQVPKTAGKDGGVLLFNGLPIYRETEFTTDLTAEDVLVQHTSVGEVIAKPATQLNS